MIYLAFSILSSTGIFVLFKLINQYQINTLQAIVVNYITACLFGFLVYDGDIQMNAIINTSWFYAALGLGILFIAVFNIMALTAQKNGLSVASVASKMSVIIPVIFGILILNESISLTKILGIILALLAVYLASMKSKENVVLTQSLYLPLLVFLGTGIVDTSVNFLAPKDNIVLFSACIFGSAFCAGSLVLVIRAVKQNSYFKLKSIPIGIILGIVNYASIFYLLKALRIDGLESSTLFTINHVTIVALSTIAGLLLFKEKISLKNWLGIAIAVTAIILVTLIDDY